MPRPIHHHRAQAPSTRIKFSVHTGVKKLPLNLLDVIRALEDSAFMAESLGALVPAYLKLKKHEWNEYARHLTDWERETTLDC